MSLHVFGGSVCAAPLPVACAKRALRLCPLLLVVAAPVGGFAIKTLARDSGCMHEASRLPSREPSRQPSRQPIQLSLPDSTSETGPSGLRACSSTAVRDVVGGASSAERRALARLEGSLRPLAERIIAALTTGALGVHAYLERGARDDEAARSDAAGGSRDAHRGLKRKASPPPGREQALAAGREESPHRKKRLAFQAEGARATFPETACEKAAVSIAAGGGGGGNGENPRQQPPASGGQPAAPLPAPCELCSRQDRLTATGRHFLAVRDEFTRRLRGEYGPSFGDFAQAAPGRCASAALWRICQRLQPLHANFRAEFLAAELDRSLQPLETDGPLPGCCRRRAPLHPTRRLSMAPAAVKVNRLVAAVAGCLAEALEGDLAPLATGRDARKNSNRQTDDDLTDSNLSLPVSRFDCPSPDSTNVPLSPPLPAGHGLTHADMHEVRQTLKRFRLYFQTHLIYYPSDRDDRALLDTARRLLEYCRSIQNGLQ